MKLNELISKRSEIIDQMEAIITDSETKERSMNEEELERWNNLDKEQKELEKQINQRKAQDELNAKKINSQPQVTTRTMIEFKDLLVRNGEKIENFKVRGITLANGIKDETIANNMSVVGYEPFYKSMGVELFPNLASNLKLPYLDIMTAQKKASGERYDNDKVAATVTLEPQRFTITETIDKALLSVGNEAALNNFLFEMVKSADRAVTKEIFDVVLAGATEVTGLTAYTSANVDTLVSAIDGDVKVLMPRAEFYKAKGVKLDAGSGYFLANRTDQYTGSFWDGTPIFYSQLFAPSTATNIVAADLKHVTVGEFGTDYEVIFDYTSKAPEGQVVITVVKLADVKLRNAAAARFANIA